ncbi:MAG TPA: DMT family transporter [Acidimicrobiales bacterium]|nr:DMT family transporter [Acidimicrobiales bacterium]
MTAPVRQGTDGPVMLASRAHKVEKVMAYLLAVGAALANALTTILQRMGLESAPAETNLRWSLMAFALRRKVWLAGFACMVGAFLFQFTALHFGRLTVVQPILTLELPFLVAILGIWFRQQLGWREWAGSLLAAGGLAVFLVLASPGGGSETPTLYDWGLVSIAVIGGGTISVMLTRVGSSAWKAAMFGVAAAIAFAFTAALMKETNADIGRGWAGVFTKWPPYALAVSGLAGLFLMQNAFRAGPVTASQSTLVIVDPLASIAIGIGLFGDHVQTAGGRGAGEALALVVLFLGAFSLTRSPLIISVKTEDGESNHILSQRHRGVGGRSDPPDWTSGDPATAPG